MNYQFQFYAECLNSELKVPKIYSQPLTCNPPSSNSAQGDPHFTQIIQNSLSQTNDKRKICYDVTGKAGQNIHIISFFNQYINVYGKLLDDYYMHQIKIVSPLHNLTIFTHQILQNGNVLTIWKDRPENFYHHLNGFSLKFIGRNLLKIQKISMDNENKFSLIFERGSNYDQRKYLNIQIQRENQEDYNGIGGLLGRIGNNKYKIYDTVQDNQDKIFTNINGKFVWGEKKASNDDECIFFQLKDLIFSDNLENLIKF